MRKLTLALLLVIALGLALPDGMRIAVGHAEYDRSEPAADSVVTVAPTQVRIWFTQELFRRQGENRIEVAAADGTRVDQGDVTIDDDDRKLMRVSLVAALPAGIYTVHWYALSAEDGHAGEGEFTFTVDSAVHSAAPTLMTDTVAVTDTLAALTVTNIVSDTPEQLATPGPTSTVPVPATPTLAQAPMATPAAPTSTLPCLGGAAPLVLALGIIVIRRRL